MKSLLLCVVIFCFGIINTRAGGDIVNDTSARSVITTSSISDIVATYSKNMTDYAVNSRGEKLYLHIDKECCQPGDTLFFKGYLVSAVTNVPVDYSRYIYVEVVDRRELVYLREKISKDTMLNAFCGYLPMSENLHQGEYFIRAYTYSMQNEPEEFLFRKRIRVINPHDNRIKYSADVETLRNGKRILKIQFLNAQNERYENIAFQYKIPGETPDSTFLVGQTGYNGQCRIEINNSQSDHIWISFDNSALWSFEKYIPIPGAKRDFDLLFFPEGGALIPGVKQRIAFKAIGRDGMGIAVEGIVRNSAGMRVADFTSNHLGMGSFYLQTSLNETYHAESKSEQGVKKEFSLPKPEHNAIALQLESNGTEVIYKTLSSGLMADYSDKFILIHSRGIPLAISPLMSMEGKIMNLSSAPGGIIHFAIIDIHGNVYSDRLWFHHHQSYSKEILLDAPAHNIHPRDDAKMKILLDSCVPFELSNCSISVTNNGQMLYSPNGMTIESNLLLTSDLKGYVESPGYYFNTNNADNNDALEHLLLTQGWSKFSLTDVLRNSYSRDRKYYMERGQFLSGRVKNYWGKRPLYDNSIILIGTNGIARELQTDSSGYFVEEDIWYDEGTRFIVQALTPKGRSNLELQLDNQEFRISKSIEPLSVCCNDIDFYTKYGKDYIFADNGERITTMGEVKVQGGPMAMRKQIVEEYVKRDMRRMFHLGVTDIQSYGSAPWSTTGLLGARSAAYRIYADLLHAADNHTEPVKRPGGNAFNRPQINFLSLPNVDEDLARAWSAIEDSDNVGNGERAKTLIQRNDYHPPRLLGTSVLLLDESAWTAWNGGIQNIPIWDFTVNNFEIQFNMQTIVPFAPQQNNVEFYVPSYNVDTELLKEMVDEKITRYWNPNVKLSSDKPFEFTFPTADGAGNRSYTITIEGITENGTPIHKTFQYSL
ncbi:MAG: hypothetical protein J6K74_06020 [Marinifilaceae bacterium]|nr:hypothetical protein [Marinifilaceae bacterium]